MNELAKIISVHKRSRSMHAIENFPHSCDISISRFISFFTYSSWVFYRVCPKITFKFKRRVKNLSGFYVFSVDFCCFCFGSNERICFCCSFFLLQRVCRWFFFWSKSVSSVSLFSFIIYLVGVIFIHRDHFQHVMSFTQIISNKIVRYFNIKVFSLFH